ncbi:hypothetical protein SAMN05444161_5586 [Rhizobiales bacterium GAS191]|nr:hypothetical protein SAMN05444161_5586 [Rhizobiales bacterium GAS191]
MLDCRPIRSKGARRRDHRLMAIGAFNVTRPDGAFDLWRNSEVVRHGCLLNLPRCFAECRSGSICGLRVVYHGTILNANRMLVWHLAQTKLQPDQGSPPFAAQDQRHFAVILSRDPPWDSFTLGADSSRTIRLISALASAPCDKMSFRLDIKPLAQLSVQSCATTPSCHPGDLCGRLVTNSTNGWNAFKSELEHRTKNQEPRTKAESEIEIRAAACAWHTCAAVQHPWVYANVSTQLRSPSPLHVAPGRCSLLQHQSRHALQVRGVRLLPPCQARHTNTRAYAERDRIFRQST